MEKKHFDIVIIGGGSAGLGALGMSEKLGWKPLLVDKEEANIGGDCLNFGCVPSKALIHLGKLFYGAKRSTEFGLQMEGKANMEKILAFVHGKQEVIRAHESADYFRSKGIDLKIGTASFVDRDTMKIGDEYFTADRFLIATGSRPRWIPFKGIEQVKNIFTNENLFYEMKKLPDRLLIVGGGAIGCEMAQVFQRFGSQVTIVNRGARILGKEREEMSQILTTQFQKEGIEIIGNASLKEFSDSNTALVEVKEKGMLSIEFDAVLMAIGRQLNLEDLDLEKGGVETDERGRMKLDDYLQTTNPKVFAAGDCAGMYQFSHGAEKHIRLLQHNFDSNFRIKHDIKDLSWVTFTDPEVATFGYTEEYLQKNNISYWRQDQDFKKDDRAIVGEYTYGKIALFLTNKSFLKKGRRILGGSIIAPNAGEIIQELQLAANNDIPIDQILDKLYAYPTASRINQQTVMGVINYDKEH